MIEGNTDLRMIRTRKFIIDSFIQLLEKKDFNSIKIRDITSGAMINRAVDWEDRSSKSPEDYVEYAILSIRQLLKNGNKE